MTIWLTDDEQRDWRRFVTMQSRLMAQLAAHMQAEGGMSVPDYEVLVHLTEAPGGRMRSTDLLELTCWEKSRLSHHLTRMEKRGFVTRETRPDDLRYSDVVITAEGRAAIEAAAPMHVTHVRSWFVDALTAEELATFAALCDKVTTRLDEATPACPAGA
ncbi:MarR family winged helix-turn-helix transcriptional regulator [Catenuloplanes atrovinosus]|uniref:DNA-binding MarR family transcriptional regulator n=1 Tax=Catenuloplanes atrovinosus TaxID=137266 RepID=A0AAE4CCB4_9ACTN|nr:MarR family winged helix-turn-helix transcriptional regulator [Catenuloplanes atrovinosus]MDR7279057.1 DNA-binding MarR family transcriptional regulator [Catenuloplanes atrovinosus]